MGNLALTIRNARNNGVLSFAKLFSLTLSFVVILFAAGYIYFETSFDKSIPDYNKIYRCLMQGQLGEEAVDFAITSPEQAAAIVNDIPEIEEAVRLLYRGEAFLIYNNQEIGAEKLYYADPEIFSFFNIPIQTNMENPLSADNYISIARSFAIKQFGSVKAALGKVIELRGEDCIVSGVFDDLPKNFHLQIALIQSLNKSNPDQVGWDSQNYYTYFKTNTTAISQGELNFKISKAVYSNYQAQIDGAAAKSLNDLKYDENHYIYFTCEALKDIHFSSHKFDSAKTANKTYVFGAAILAILVLLISSINFINLTIANISTRLKEVGIRKSVGASTKNIISQFLAETSFFFILSFVIAIFFYLNFEKSINQYLGFDIFLSKSVIQLLIAIVFISLFIFTLFTNFFAIALASNNKAISLIKGDVESKKYYLGNNSLILIQFALSGLIILGSVFVQKQINFIVDKDPGYERDNIIMLTMWEMNPDVRKSFIEKLKTYNDVLSVSTSDVYFGTDFSMNGASFETEEEKNVFHTSVLPVDYEFQNTFNFKMKEGRYFSKEIASDYSAAILNETALKYYSGEGSMVGKDLFVGGKKHVVIGIAEDFNFRSLHHPVEPLVITCIENFGNVNVKIRNSRISEVISLLEKEWKEFNISIPFSYAFHDEVVARHYVNDQQARNLLLFLSLISILIACLGLYAVSFFSILRKTKEIGIRKVNGANNTNLIIRLSKEFMRWIIIAFIIAFPIAYYLLNKWLANFAFKTTLSWWVFALTGVFVFVLALITISWQTWQAARRNPIESLRYE